MTPRIQLFGIEIDPLTMSQAVEQCLAWASAGSTTCRFVVTPNTDHLVLLEHHTALRAAYADASLILADGMPLVVASRWLGAPLPERVAGSDLAIELFNGARSHGTLRAYLLGAAPGVGERAAQCMAERWPHVQVVGTYSPPLGFEKDDTENQAILERIAAANADVLLLGLGAPKQELWVHKHRERLAAPVALCVGATIDFLAGEKRRAPVWMRRTGLEWVHRLASEPRRLFRRYAHDAWVFPQLVWRERARRKSASRPAPPLSLQLDSVEQDALGK